VYVDQEIINVDENIKCVSNSCVVITINIFCLDTHIQWK